MFRKKNKANVASNVLESDSDISDVISSESDSDADNESSQSTAPESDF